MRNAVLGPRFSTIELSPLYNGTELSFNVKLYRARSDGHTVYVLAESLQAATEFAMQMFPKRLEIWMSTMMRHGSTFSSRTKVPTDASLSLAGQSKRAPRGRPGPPLGGCFAEAERAIARFDEALEGETLDFARVTGALQDVCTAMLELVERRADLGFSTASYRRYRRRQQELMRNIDRLISFCEIQRARQDVQSADCSAHSALGPPGTA